MRRNVRPVGARRPAAHLDRKRQAGTAPSTEATIQDPDRLKALLDEQGRGLYALLFRLTRSHDVADDLLQELFARLGGSTGWHDADDPVAYAYRSARNLAFEHRRRQRPTVALDAAAERTQPKCEHAAPDAALIRAEENKAMLNALTRLDDPWRTALTMRYLEGQPYERVTVQLGKATQAQARSVVQKGLAKLRTLIEKGHDDG